MDVSAELNDSNNKMAFGPRIVRSSDPDVYSNPDSARVRARQIGCIGIRRYNNRDGSVSWMPCTNESDYRRVSGFGPSGRRFRRQQLEREVRQIMGGQDRRKPQNKSANYTKPELRETIKKRIMAGSKGGRPGQWSARKAQMVAAAYKKAGGGYKGGKTQKQRSIVKWGKEKWRTSDGKPAIRGNVTRRYLPAKAWDKLTPAQRAATNRKKIAGSKKGRQFVGNTRAAQNARKRSVRGQKHIEFYEELEFKAIGPRKPRAIRSARSTASFGRRARRIGGALRAGLLKVPFDPNPKDADDDNVVQENTIHERPLIRRAIDAIRQTTNRAAQRVAKPFRKPENLNQKPFTRAESMLDGRFIARAPQSLIQPRISQQSERPLRRKIKKSRPATDVREPQVDVSTKPKNKITSTPRVLPRTNTDDEIDNLKNERKNIYKAFTIEGATIAQLADQFDVVRDEIRDAILKHEKARSASLRGFRTRNSKLFDSIKNFGNSKNVILEAIKERKVKDWDSMVVYAFKNPEIRKNNKHIDLQNDMFDEFKTGKNPDNTGNLILGYLPSKKGPENPPIKAFGDKRKLPNDFRLLGQVSRTSSTTGTISDVSERATRRYRAQYAQAESLRRSPGISGRMATGGMTPAEERNWKKREWKRRKLQEFSLNENVVTEYPSLAAAIGDKGYVKGIEYLENLDESSLENLWNETIGEIMAAKKQLPAYQVRNAPLSPNELATAATVKRPLVKVFLDSYKKTSPVGELAKLDPDQMNDADIESFFNTFILPELVNNGAPTNQDIEQALLTPTTINRLDAAEQLLFVMPSNLKTLELRLKFAKYSLAQNGVSSDDPDFEQKLQELLVSQQNQDLEKLFGDIESFLSGGPNVKKEVINPMTGDKFTAEELDELIKIVSNNVEEIAATFPQQDQELAMHLGALYEIFTGVLQVEEFLKSGDRNAKIPPINPITNKPYKLRDWIELGQFGLRKKPNNPLTGKPYLDSELREHLGRIQEKLTELNNQLGTAKKAEYEQQNAFLLRLMEARNEIEEAYDVDDVDNEDGDLLDGQEREEKSPEEIEQEIQDILDASVELLEQDSKILTINETDIDKAKELRKRFQLEGGAKEGQEQFYPTNPDWWANAAANIINPATGEKWGPYNGDPNHPYNNVPIDLDAPELRLPQAIYREFLDPNNPEVREWSDINNSHTGGRYTAQVPELISYQGDIESLDPSKIDQRIRWDRLIPFISRVTPGWFRKKQGETVGDINTLKEPGSYGGASYSSAPFDPTVDASGYQLQAELKELFDAEVEKQEKIYLTSSSAAAKKERAKLWNLFETDGLTPSEIAFEQKILNPQFVDDALNLHMVDNNIPSAKYSQALSVARQGEQTRKQANDKKRLERTIEELREMAAFFSPYIQSARDMTDVIDAEIIRLTDVAARAGADYDSFRRNYLAAFAKINGILKTRPPQRKAKYNQKGELVQTGWDINKETKAEYINRIQRWDEENINGYINESGEKIPGVITQLVNIARMFQTMTGDDGAASSTTNIKRVAETQKDNLLRYKSRIIETERGARAAGISGFMRTGGLTSSLGRAEEITRQAAQKAAYGQFRFANPKILRRYDISGFDVTKRMIGNSSGFNKQFKNEIKDTTRNNNRNLASRPGFEYLNSREKELIRQIDNVINSRDTRAYKRKQNRNNVGAKISNAQKMATSEKTTRALSVNPNPIFLKNRISGRMATRKERIAAFGEQDYLGPRGVYQIGIEKIGEDFYLVNRHGEILDTRKFSSYEKARAAQRKINEGFRYKRRGLENSGNIARYDAANRFIRQSGYLSYDVDLQNIADVSPITRNSTNIEEPNKFIIAKDAQPQQRAGDIVVIKRNPETNKLELLAIEREFGPHRKDGESTMSLPGGFFSEKKNDKDLYDTAKREAFEETGLRLPENELLSMEKLGIIDSIDWDPRFAKGMEVAGLLVEVPSTWEWTPKPGDDAVVAKFVPLEEVANGNIPLGFGHIAWLEEAFGGHEDEELAELGDKFAVLNVLARQRQQRIIKGANEKRRALNDTPKPLQMELFKEELPKLNLFPDKLPDNTVGWIPTGPESTERHARRIANVQKKIRGNMSLGIGKPVSNLTGRMASGLKELGVEEFSKLSKTRRSQIIDDVYNMRKAGMDKRTITSQLAILYSTSPKDKRVSDLRGFAPTDELVFKIITDGKKRGILKIDSKSKTKSLDKYSKRVMSDHKDVMNLAKNGIKPKQISETLDMSEDRVKTYLSSLGFSSESSADIIDGEIDIDKRISDTQVNKSIFIDSTYGRMSIAELAKKYKMDKSKIYDSINSYRTLAESLEQDSHRLYRQALETATPDLLTTDEKDVVQMRLDGLNINEISSIKNLSQNNITDLEQTALIKLRTTNVDNFLEMSNELFIQNSRKNPTFEYMTNLLAENPKNTSGSNLLKKLKNKEFAARELRDYRNIAKDFYMMNQYMGISVDKLSRQYKITPKEVEEYVDLYSQAVNYSDKFKNKALRRALSADINNSFLDDDVNFMNMRNDGASINDISRYLQVEPLSLRAKQMVLMNRLNQQQGISGKMLNVPNLENRDLYSELSISDTSSIKEIENAFQSISTSLLPSAMKGDDVSFDGLKRASEAFSILGNPNYRDNYSDMYKENLKTIRNMELELTNNWPKSFYTEPMTGKMRPNWVRDAVNGRPINSQNIFKMPHHLGSDEIIDDIDDGILGFATNDSDKEFSISNAIYIRPIPGTKEWDKQKRATERARASGDNRFIYNEDGMVVGRQGLYIDRFDNPMSPDYVGDRYGGPPKGSSNITLMSQSSGISGKMTNLVPEGSWSIGESLKKKSKSYQPNPTNRYWERRGYDSEYLRPWSGFAQDLTEDYFEWLNLPEGMQDTEYFKKGKLSSFASDFAAMGNLKTANMMKFSPIELLDAIDEFYENMSLVARQRATADFAQSYYGGEYQRYKSSPKRPFLRMSESVPLLKDIASGKIKEFVYYDKQLFPGKIIKRDGEIFLTRQYSSYNFDTNNWSEETEEKRVNQQFETELMPVQLNMDKDREKAETYLKAVLIGSAISGPWLESNNSNIETQLLHQSVRRVFGLTDVLDPRELPGAKGSYRLGAESKTEDGETLLDSLKKEYSLPLVLKNFLDNWVKSTYEQTQKYLDDLGGDEFFHLYRGASLPEMIDGRNTDIPEVITQKWINSGAQEYDNPKQLKEVQDFQQAPLSSWTLSPAWARVFSFGRFGPSESKVGSTRESTIAQIRSASVIDAPIPKKLILSLPHSGLGTMQSGEIIVIGESLDNVRIRHSDSLPKTLWLVPGDWDYDTNRNEQPELGGDTWAFKGQRNFVDDLRSGWGPGLIYDGTAEQYLAENGISGKMAQGFVTSTNWKDESSTSKKMSGMFNGLSAKEKKVKMQKLIADFAKENSMLPKYSRGLSVPVPVFPINQLDKINKEKIKKLSKFKRVEEMLNFVRKELANDRPIYSSSNLAEVFSLSEIAISDIIGGEIPTYQSKKKEIAKRWENALSAYILDNENSTLLDMADAIDIANNERITDQAPQLSKLRKNIFGPRVPFKKRKPNKIVRLSDGQEFTQKEYKKLQQKLLKMYLEGFSSADIDKKLNLPKKWAKYQLNKLQKNKKLPKPPSPEISIIKYAAEGLTASEIMNKFQARKNWRGWDLEKILNFVEKDGRFPNFKRGFNKIDDALDDNMVIRKSSQNFRKKKKKMNARAIAERERIFYQRQKQRRQRMKIEDPIKYQELIAKRKARYNAQYYRDRRNQTNLPKISGRMGPLPRKDWKGRDFYAELNADKNDTLKTLRKKFGLIAMRDHPDKAPGDKQAAERFRKASEAWSVLSSSEERRHYDAVVYPTLPNQQNTRPQQSSSKPPSSNPQPPKPSNPQPPRPPRPKLPPLDDSLGKRIGIDLPFTKTNLPYDFYEDSFIKHSQKYKSDPGKKSFVKIPSTFGPSIEIEENRFWDVYFKIADALSGKKNTNKNPRFISVGGAPGSGKTSIRKSNFASTDKGINVDIPGVDKAVHVDADEIKPLIPEAKNAHANNLPDWASMVHEESRVISDMAIRMGIEKNQDIVYDSTGQFNRGFGTLEEARKKGYSVELHYMVASLEKTLSDRVQTRAGSDPRTMPGHIIPATLYRNKSIMHEVIDYADKFYLWDTESKTPKLLAYKAGPNDPLIIKDSRAFLHGYLEKTKNKTPQELENIKKMFDAPDFNLKSIAVSKKSRSASIIADFKNSKSVNATASKFKITPREVFDIVTKSFVDPSMKEPRIINTPIYGRYGFPRGVNNRFNPTPLPPIIPDGNFVDRGPEDFIDTTPFDLSFDEDYSPPFSAPEVWFDELGQVEIQAFAKNQPLLSRALFSYEPREAHVLDLIAVTNSAKKSWEARFPEGSKYDDNFVSFLREEISFDDFWDEIENDFESGSASNMEYDDVITALINNRDKESTRKFLEQFKDIVRNLLNVYPGSKSEPAINPFNPKNSNSVEVEETTRAIRELISNDLPYDSPLGTMWAFTYNIRLDLFKEMYDNVAATNNIFGRQ